LLVHLHLPRVDPPYSSELALSNRRLFGSLEKKKQLRGYRHTNDAAMHNAVRLWLQMGESNLYRVETHFVV